MSQGRQNTRGRYVYGSTAEEFIRELEEAPKHKTSKQVRQNREKASRMNLPYVLFLTGALAVCAFMLINYVRLQSGITDSINQAARQESKYISQKIENDEEYDRIINSVDLNEVKRIAIEQLGMHYATEGQIITYTDEMKDYVRLYSDVAE